jgi:hypothetical protein
MQQLHAGFEIPLPAAAEHNKGMGFIYFLADTFINTFGITQPTEKARKQAAFFILTLIILTITVATVVFVVLHAYMK